MSEFKRFLAYEIIKRLKQKNQIKLLEYLKQGVAQNENQKGKKHQVFKSSFDAKKLESGTDVLAILEYMHHNPVKGKWMLVDDYCHYRHSSAGYYEKELPCEYPIWDFREIDGF